MNNRVIMPTQDASLRKSNFNEVALGYSKEDAMNEASRCLHCKTKPCVSGCPVNIDIPEFIQKIKEDNIDEAAKIINEASLFGRICGRVCPQECQCEAKCVRGLKGEAIAIGNLERFVSDNAKPVVTAPKKPNGKKVAIVGSGPSGLACAYDLAKEGCSVTIYESLHATGGVLRYGIPEFILPKTIVDDEVNKLKALNVNIYTNKVVGKTIFMEELQRKYDAIYVASGAGLPKFMGIEGENLNGVYSANEFLTRINLMKAYDASPTPIYHARNVCVVGGGNVAMDAARCALRLNPEN
ncbi:MAG: FAD-dependent oxidoreductase, partial [Bacilli bacterium]|nr:FAD-dependent oxidoreductase [Bacilli bacterium]